MGYSTSVTFKSAKTRDGIYKFLTENLAPCSTLVNQDKQASKACEYCGNPDYDYTRFLSLGEDLAYSKGKNRIGYNYTTTEPYGTYMYSVLSWAALKAGVTHKFKGLPRPMPCTRYDNEPWAILQESDLIGLDEETKKKYGWNVRDSLGFRPTRSMWTSSMLLNATLDVLRLVSGQRKSDKHMDRIVQAEIQRIDKLWKEQHS